MQAFRKLFVSELFNIKFEYTKHAMCTENDRMSIIESFVLDSVRLKGHCAAQIESLLHHRFC